MAEPGTHSRLGFELGADSISFALDETVYSLEVVYGACYLFLDKCFVYLSRPKSETVGVRLTTRSSATPADLDALAQPQEQAWLAEREAYLLYK